MDAAEKLLAIEEIHQLKARYFRCVDTKDWKGYRAVFADEVEFDITEDMPEAGIVTSGDKAAKIAQEGMGGAQSVHHGHCPEIEITSPTTARGIWAMEDMLFWDEGSVAPGQRLHGMGHYHETYEKIGGEWKIKTMKLTRLYRVFTPAKQDA